MRRSGQVALYLLMVIVAVCILALMNVDVFVSVRTKNRLQNAGDAAALAAARRQGRVLNEIGRLNVEHLVAAANDETERCARIVMEQRRLALLGPVEAIREADEAARKNGMEPRPEFSRILREHVAVVRTVYSGGGQAGDPYPEPWPGAWPAYAAAIEEAIADGLAAGPDNIEFYGAEGGHLLLTKDFYHAIAGRNWCWFHFNAEGTLNSYKTYADWAPLPRREESSMDNSEIFSLHVRAVTGPATDIFRTKACLPGDCLKTILDIVGKYGAEDDLPVDADILAKSHLIHDPNQVWFRYESGAWREWEEISPFGEWNFPVVGTVRPEYDVRGCAAILRCVNDISSTAIDNRAQLTWAAAAKPFGKIDGDDGALPVSDERFGRFVLPCFEAVRLVPLDSVGGRDLSTADAGWVDHVRHHLGHYMQFGPAARGCYYCLQLETWENPVFRASGIEWIRYNAKTCVRPTGGGGGGHGGTSHGH